MSNYKSVNNIKYAIYREWSYDPPAGEITLYYGACGSTKELLWPIDEIYDHLSQWSHRKGKIFNDYRFIEIARKHLIENGFDYSKQ